MADEDVFYMRVDEPVEIRKQLLESSRICLQNLHRTQQFESIRREKSMKINALRHRLAELNELVVKLRNLLPDAMPAPPEKELKKLVRKDRRLGREVHSVHADKSVEKIHHQLKAIEHKLNSLV